jgi:penicillin-binding protein-related factor A (putative recombinase)
MGYPGVADILGCYKGRMIAIELKSPKGKATPDQERFLQNVNDAGGIGFVARTIDEVIEGLQLQDRFLLR